jgi:hypothetical protein
MADPATMGMFGIGSTILGGMMKAKSDSASADAQAGGLQYQAALSMLNAQINEQNSNYELWPRCSPASGGNHRRAECIGTRH